MKADRNKTIDITVEDGKEYLEKCVIISQKAPLDSVIDKTLLGDMFEILKLLPENSIDLLIVDPPYNLDKNFNGRKFKKTSDEMYEEYTESWISLTIPLLKDNATIYVCCDWQSSPRIYLFCNNCFKLIDAIFIVKKACNFHFFLLCQVI